MTDLTNADDFELVDGSDNVRMEATNVNRWTKKGDRLYINDVRNIDGGYIDLETGEIHDVGMTSAEVTVDDGRITVEYTNREGLLGEATTHTYTVVIGFETDDETEDDAEGEETADEEDEKRVSGGVMEDIRAALSVDDDEATAPNQIDFSNTESAVSEREKTCAECDEPAETADMVDGRPLCSTHAQRGAEMLVTDGGRDHEEGDYIIGESAVYEIKSINETEYDIRVACTTGDTSSAEKNSGRQSADLVETLGPRVSRERVESISISDGDTITWEGGNEDGSEALAHVTIGDDGSVVIESDGLLVPGQLADVLVLKCNIALGYAAKIVTGEREADTMTEDADGDEDDGTPMTDGGRDRDADHSRDDVVEMALEYRDELLRDLGVVGVTSAGSAGEKLRDLAVGGVAAHDGAQGGVGMLRSLYDIGDVEEDETPVAGHPDARFLTVREAGGGAAALGASSKSLGWSTLPTPREIVLAEYLEAISEDDVRSEVVDATDDAEAAGMIFRALFPSSDRDDELGLWLPVSETNVDNVTVLEECVGAVADAGRERYSRVAYSRDGDAGDDEPRSEWSTTAYGIELAVEAYRADGQTTHEIYARDRAPGAEWRRCEGDVDGVGLLDCMAVVDRHDGEQLVDVDTGVYAIPELRPPEDVLGLEAAEPATPHREGVDVPDEETEAWRLRAGQLHELGGVPERQSQVAALIEMENTHRETADELGVSHGNVATLLDEYRNRKEESDWLAENGPSL